MGAPYANGARYFPDESARWMFLRARLCVAFIGIDTRPTRTDSDTRRVSFGSKSYDVLLLYDVNIYIITRLVSQHYARELAILISDKKRHIALGPLR